MQHLKWFLFLVFVALVAATNRQQTDADTVLEMVKLNYLENVLEQDWRLKQMACKLRPQTPGCHQPSTKEQTVLSKLDNSARINHGNLKFKNSVEKRQKKCRPRPGASWCKGRR